MRIAPAITLSSDPQATLEQWARRRSLPARVVERARIVLLAAEGRQDKQIASAVKITPKKVARWRSRFLTLGLAGLQRDASRPGRTPKITASLVRRVVNLTTRQSPPNATHWSTRTMAFCKAPLKKSLHGLERNRVSANNSGTRFSLMLIYVFHLALAPIPVQEKMHWGHFLYFSTGTARCKKGSQISWIKLQFGAHADGYQ